MSKNKIWKIRGLDASFSDEELIDLIKQGKIKKETFVSSKDMKIWISLKDSIYQFYFEEDTHETLQ